MMAVDVRKKAKILVVDDEPNNLQVMIDSLADYDISVALNGKQALRLVEEWVPDIILMDICMPEMDGFETCREIKKLKNRSLTPVIFLTVLDDMKNKIQAYLAGGVDFITKPVDLDKITDRLDIRLRVLERNRAKKEASGGHDTELWGDVQSPYSR